MIFTPPPATQRPLWGLNSLQTNDLASGKCIDVKFNSATLK